MNYFLQPSTDYPSLLHLYRELTGLENRTHDYYETRFRQRGESTFFLTAFIMSDSKRVGLVEFGKYFLADSPDSAHLSIFINPEAWDARGFHDLISRIEQTLRENRFHRVVTSVFDVSYRDEFLTHGFALAHEYVESEYPLMALLAEPYPSLPEGFFIKSFADLKKAHQEETFEFVFDCVRNVLCDIPGQESFAKEMVVQTLKDAWQGSHFNPDGCLFLMNSNEVIGVHNIVSFSQNAATSGVTGIVPAYRRKGLMRYLKRHGMIWAAKRGFVLFRSDNEINNPMLTLNQQLGFREIRRHYELTKQL